MPTYHLHLHNAHIDADDVEGYELADIDAAQSMAISGIRDFLGHELMNGDLDLRGRIDIEDDDGVVLRTVHFRDAISIRDD